MRIDGARLIADAAGALFRRLDNYRLPGGRIALRIGDSRVSFNPDFRKEVTMSNTFVAGSTKAFSLAVTDAWGTIASAGAAGGPVQFKATFDADLGDGVKELVALADLEVVAGEAVAGTISFG